MFDHNEKFAILFVLADEKLIELVQKSLERKREDEVLDFAKSFKEAKQKLQERVYFAAVFELYLPQEEGGELEPLGFELAKEASRKNLFHALFNSCSVNPDNQYKGTEALFVRFSDDEKINQFIEKSYSPETIDNFDLRLKNFKPLKDTEMRKFLNKKDELSWRLIYDRLTKNYHYLLIQYFENLKQFQKRKIQEEIEEAVNLLNNKVNDPLACALAVALKNLKLINERLEQIERLARGAKNYAEEASYGISTKR